MSSQICFLMIVGWVGDRGVRSRPAEKLGEMADLLRLHVCAAVGRVAHSAAHGKPGRVRRQESPAFRLPQGGAPPPPLGTGHTGPRPTPPAANPAASADAG